MENQNATRIEYFNLNNDGDTAVVRLLHTTTQTIESSGVHWIEEGGKKHQVKCLDTDCPLCKAGNSKTDRIFIHLFDYTDNKEKVWSRTDRIISQLQSIVTDWGDLSSCVLRLTRKGKEFPRYEISVLNANQYAPVDKSMIDQKVSYRFYKTRDAKALEQYLATGVLPQRETTYIPREEYLKQKQQEVAKQAPMQQYNQQIKAQPQQQYNNQSVGYAQSYQGGYQQQNQANQYQQNQSYGKPMYIPAQQQYTPSYQQQSQPQDDPFMFGRPRRV